MIGLDDDVDDGAHAAYVALLRGINLGSHNKIKMPELKELFSSLGYTGAVTYLQSGNVVFRGRHLNPPEVAQSLEEAIAGKFGHSVNVLVRTGEDIARIVDANPFARTCEDPTKLHVTFLEAASDSSLLRSEDADGAKPDEFEVRGAEIFLYCPQGYGRTKLSNTFWERRLRVRATTRNWNTVRALKSLTED